MAALLLWPCGVISCQGEQTEFVTKAEGLSGTMRKACLSHLGTRQLWQKRDVSVCPVKVLCKIDTVLYIDYASRLWLKKKQKKHPQPWEGFSKSHFYGLTATWRMALHYLQISLLIFLHKNTRRLPDKPAGLPSWQSTCSKLAPVSLCACGWRRLAS